MTPRLSISWIVSQPTLARGSSSDCQTSAGEPAEATGFCDGSGYVGEGEAEGDGDGCTGEGDPDGDPLGQSPDAGQRAPFGQN